MNRLGEPIMGRCQSCAQRVHAEDVARPQDLEGGACPLCGDGPIRAVAWGARSEDIETLAPSRPTGRACIFCARTPLTREHLWPQWIGRTFPGSELHRSSDQNRRIIRRRTANFGAGVVQVRGDERKRRGGSRADRTIRAVCGTCNNGWMAHLEGEAQPILTRLATDRAAVLDDAEAAVVTRWRAKTSAVFEWDDPESASLPQWALQAIAAGDETSLRTHWTVHAAWLFEPSFEMSRGLVHGLDPIAGADATAQWTGLLQTIALNHAGFLVEFDPVGGIFPDLGLQPPRMRPLWPHLDARSRPGMNRGEWRYLERLEPLKELTEHNDRTAHVVDLFGGDDD